MACVGVHLGVDDVGHAGKGMALQLHGFGEVKIRPREIHQVGAARALLPGPQRKLHKIYLVVSSAMNHLLLIYY